MTIDEAILQLKVWTKADERDLPIRVKDAIQLGIEALKWVKKYRGCLDFHEYDLLPGETEE